MGDNFSEGDTTNGIFDEFDDLFHDYKRYQECDDDLFDDFLFFIFFDDLTMSLSKDQQNSTRPYSAFCPNIRKNFQHMSGDQVPLLSAVTESHPYSSQKKFALPSRWHNPSY